MSEPTVSVVVVNFNGKRHLEPCFNSLLKQDFPLEKIELLLVDNTSQDGSLELMAARFPMVRVIANDSNMGFAAAVNQGARAATGQYLALINNDAYADPAWLRTMVERLERDRDRGVVCVGAKMLDWYGQHIDFVGGGVNFYGMGNQFFHTLPTDAVNVDEHDVLFACGGAMLVDRQVFLWIGGFDADYFAYFEDVDFGWRLWVYGYRVLYVPDAVVYHRQHGTASSLHRHQINRLFERNALITILKNYEDAHLQQVLGASLMLLIKRSLGEAGTAIDFQQFDIGHREQRDASTQEMAVPKVALSHLVALNDIMNEFPKIWQKRDEIQAHRVRPDREIFPYFKAALSSNFHQSSYLIVQQILTDAFGIRELFAASHPQRILILSSDPIYDRVAGPAIRAIEMARNLAQFCHVVLAAPDQVDVTILGVTCVALQRGFQGELERLTTEVEVVIVQGFALRKYPFLKRLSRVLVVDLYDPFHLENLQLHSRYNTEEAYHRTSHDREVVDELLKAGDFFICASERQRDFWLGALGSLGRLSPEAYRTDPTYRSLIDVVSFGIDPDPPVHRKHVLKGVVPGIALQDIVVLWGGGLWDWLDPLTVIHAMDHLREHRPDIKLFFLGRGHPNPVDVPETPMYDRAVALAQELGLVGENVFFNDHWVPYTERASYLLEADIGVSAHQQHIETHFSFRTRLLDYIWARLPMVVTRGDTLADFAGQRGLGHVVPVGDSQALAAAILALADTSDRRAAFAPAFAAVQEELTWPQVLKPLIQFCRHPRYAADRQRVVPKPTVEPEAVDKPAQIQIHERLDELERTIARKDEHIVYLESLIKRISRGRVMRTLGTLARLRP